MSDNPRMDVPDSAADEQAGLREGAIAVQLSEQLARLRDHLVEAFPSLEVLGFRGELTLIAPAHQAPDVLAFCRDDPAVRCEILADLSCVHWLGGQQQVHAQETTGWPTYTEDAGPGRIEIDYILYSVTHNHRFRVRAYVSDDGGRIGTATGVYASANVMEREAYDFFGVVFEGHPNLRRMHMPDDWEGHPQRKDYPLGGVEVQYKGATVPPPDERKY